MDNVKPNAKVGGGGFYLQPSWVFTERVKYRGIYVKKYLTKYTLGYLDFTNRVMTDFGSNFIKISHDFSDLKVGRT